MLPLEPCFCALSPSIRLFFQVYGSFSMYLSFFLINLSSWNHGKKNESPYGYVSPYIFFNMNNMLPLKYDFDANATAQLEHRSVVLSMMILGLIHASSLCHTIHHEEKYMSIMK
jgi:hypothetical protein